MNLIFDKIFLEHITGMHPESPKRLMSFENIKPTTTESGEKYLELVHRREYIQRVKQACTLSLRLDDDTITSPGSWLAALHAVGAAIQASSENSFALVRPPGHHAYPEKSSGFCLFNNVSIAVQKLVNEGKKVLIFDFDGHLGDGTSHIFYESAQVLYWSQHQYPAFPGHGFVNEIGAGNGKGFSINVPLPPHCGDDIFMVAVHSILPIAQQFHPDIVAISAGFDAHRFDPLLDLQVTACTFYKIGKLFSEKCDNIFATLEGGYSVMDLFRGVSNFMVGANGESMPHHENETSSGQQQWETYDINKHDLFSYLDQFWQI